MELTKMTFKVHGGMWAAFNKQMRALPIQISKFLNDVIAIETEQLLNDMDGKVLSRTANRYISNRLLNNKLIETTPISIQVDKATALRLKEVVAKTNIVRDAFFNRLIMFLRSSDDLLRYLELPHYQSGIFNKVSTGPYSASPMKAFLEVFADPLELLRFAVTERWHVGLYLVDLPESLDGFSCYLDESRIPGTKEFKGSTVALEEMLKDFEQFEAITLVRRAQERR